MRASPEEPDTGLLPTEVQRLILSSVWQSDDPTANIWSRRATRNPLRLVCKAWRDEIDRQDDEYAVVQSAAEVEWYCATRADADGQLSAMRCLCVLLWYDHEAGADALASAGRALWRLVVMAQELQHLAIFVKNQRSHAISEIREAFPPPGVDLDLFPRTLRSFAFLPSDNFVEVPANTITCESWLHILRRNEHLARIETATVPTSQVMRDPETRLKTLPALTQLKRAYCSVIHLPDRSLPTDGEWLDLALVRRVPQLDTLGLSEASDWLGSASTNEHRPLGHLRELLISAHDLRHLDPVHLPSLSRLIVLDNASLTDLPWSRLAPFSFDVVEFRHDCPPSHSNGLPPETIREGRTSGLIHRLVDPIPAYYGERPGELPFRRFIFRCVPHCKTAYEAVPLAAFCVQRGVTFEYARGHDLGWTCA